MDVTLREAAAEHREELQRLLGDYLFEFDGRTEPPERVPFLIEVDGEVVGLCLIRVHGDGWDIAEFTVVPERRRSGLGRAAVEALAERARAAGAAHLLAKVHPDNTRALSFWLAAGFLEIAASGPVVTRREL